MLQKIDKNNVFYNLSIWFEEFHTHTGLLNVAILSFYLQPAGNAPVCLS